MSQITAITPQIKDKGRVNIFIDGKFCCGMQLETVVKNRLKAGCEITSSDLAVMQLESEKSVALDKAMGFISSSVKTEKGVFDYLVKKGYTQPVAAYCVQKLVGYGYLDDATYVKAYFKKYSKTKGVRLITLELKAKGIKADIISEIAEEYTDETDNAKAVADKYLKGKVRDFKNLQKAYKYLLSKGFSYETAKNAIKGEECDEF